MKVLLTGGTGYIGSHTAVELLDAGHEVIMLDNLSNSGESVVKSIENLTRKKSAFVDVDMRDYDAVRVALKKTQPDAVIHFAALKAVGESVLDPLKYYENNVGGTISLLKAMRETGVTKLVFSSSATVYGSAPYPYQETMQIGIGVTSPYGKTKVVVENLLEDIARSDPNFECISLRYFNPVGAHPSGELGEHPKGVPNNLMPYITEAAAGKRDKLSIFGDDYPTPDGTCIRDYIHVIDVAKGHVAALSHLKQGFDAVNLGSGKGTSVLELVRTFEKVCDVSVAQEIAPRRPGDLAEYYADVSKAERLWGWHTTLSIDDMCRDAWNWQQRVRSTQQ